MIGDGYSVCGGLSVGSEDVRLVYGRLGSNGRRSGVGIVKVIKWKISIDKVVDIGVGGSWGCDNVVGCMISKKMVSLEINIFILFWRSYNIWPLKPDLTPKEIHFIDLGSNLDLFLLGLHKKTRNLNTFIAV